MVMELSPIACCCMPLTYSVIPALVANTSATPNMPILPAKDVSIVRPFLLSKLRKDRNSAVKKDIPTRFLRFGVLLLPFEVPLQSLCALGCVLRCFAP